MTSQFLYRTARRVAGHFWDTLHPKAAVWSYLRHYRGQTPIITQLTGGMRVRIYPNDVVGEAIYIHGIFERREASFVTRYLKPGMTFLDVGANLGQYTLLGAQRVGSTGQVHSFEPSNRMFAELTFNVDLNAISRHCFLNRLALSDRIGTAALSQYLPGAEVFGSLGKNHWAEAQVVGEETVETTTLDDYVKRNNLHHVDLIKMDIEGAELLALRGGRQLLSRNDAPAIILEMADVNAAGFDYTALDTWNYLQTFGYSFYQLPMSGLILKRITRPPEFDGINLVALKHASQAVVL